MHHVSKLAFIYYTYMKTPGAAMEFQFFLFSSSHSLIARTMIGLAPLR